jgi:hypothetical protein
MYEESGNKRTIISRTNRQTMKIESIFGTAFKNTWWDAITP